MTTRDTVHWHLLAFCAALLGATTANAERITAADLINGEMPASSLSSFSQITWYNQNIGSSTAIFSESDASYGLFNLAAASSEDGCGVDVTLYNSQCVNTYAIRAARSTQWQTVSRAPRKWQVWGKTSAENAEWVLLSTEENQTDWEFSDNGGDASVYGLANSPGETRLYQFRSSNVKYKHLRFRFLENNGDATYLLVTRIIIYPPTTPNTGATAETFAGCTDLVPASTSATASRYTSTTHTSNDAFYLGDVRTVFSDADPARVLMKNVADGKANFIYEFGTDDKKIVNGYMIRFPNAELSNPSRAPFAWTFSGSDDYDTWTTLDTRYDQFGWVKNEKRFFAFRNQTAYAYYKIEVTQNNGETNDDYYYEFGNLDYYFAPHHIYIDGLEVAVSGGTLTISGTLAADSLPAHVSLSLVTNGVPLTCDCGDLESGAPLLASFPMASGVVFGTLTAVSGSHTNNIAIGPSYFSGEGAARFVSPDGSDSNAGTLESPMRRIATAVADLGVSGGAVYVLPGNYTETNDLTAVELSAPVSVIGITGNPADVTVTQNAPCKCARIFKLSNESALVRGMTISGGRVVNEPTEGHTAVEANTITDGKYPSWAVGVHGGNVHMSAGLVENCVIADGNAARFSSGGGNVYIEGGRLSRCDIVGGKTNRTYLDNSTRGSGGILALGGIVESCVIRDCDSGAVPVYAAGTSKFVNCTITGNSSGACGGVAVEGNNSRIVNTVIFGNRNIGGERNPEAGTCNVYAASVHPTVPTDASAAFVNCASDGDSAINATCRLVDASAFADAANGDYSPASKASPLVDAGADYSANGGVSQLDVVGAARVWTKRVDIGAYEFQYEQTKGGFFIIFK